MLSFWGNCWHLQIDKIPKWEIHYSLGNLLFRNSFTLSIDPPSLRCQRNVCVCVCGWLRGVVLFINMFWHLIWTTSVRQLRQGMFSWRFDITYTQLSPNTLSWTSRDLYGALLLLYHPDAPPITTCCAAVFRDTSPNIWCTQPSFLLRKAVKSSISNSLSAIFWYSLITYITSP